MNPLKEWMKLSTPEQKTMLANLANTSVASLRLASQGYRTDGDISLSAEFAGRIAAASAILTFNNPDLPIIKREDLCPACANCSYQKQCNAK